MTTPIFLIIRTWLQANFEYKHPHHIFFDFCPAIYIEKKKEKEKREAHGEREEKESDPTRPATVIRSDLPFRATVSVELGTDRKPLSRWSSPCRLCRRKASGKPPIEAVRSRGNASSIGHGLRSSAVFYQHLLGSRGERKNAASTGIGAVKSRENSLLSSLLLASKLVFFMGKFKMVMILDPQTQ